MERRNLRTTIIPLVVFLTMLTVALYWPVTSYHFLNYDDREYVTLNSHVLQGLKPSSIRWAFTTFDGANWHPLAWLSHQADVTFFGLDSGKHHLASLLLHTLTSVLLFLVLWKMTGTTWPCLLTAILFAVHPLQVESVAWVAERKNVLSGFFWILTMVFYLAYLRRPTLGGYTSLLVSYVLGLMAKPMLVTLPLALLLLDYWPLGRLSRHTRSGLIREGFRFVILEKLPLLTAAFIDSVIVLWAQQKGGAVKPMDIYPLATRLESIPLEYVSYLSRLAWPQKLAVFYPYPRTLSTWHMAGAAILLASMSLAVWFFATRLPHSSVGWAWFLATLVPVIDLIKIGSHFTADRYLYIPSIGVFLAVAWGLHHAGGLRKEFRWLAPGAAVLTVIALGAATRYQLGFWRDGSALFRRAIAVTDSNWLAYHNLASSKMDLGNYQEALADIKSVLQLRPDYAPAYYNQGLAYGQTGRLSDAAASFQQALRLDPSDPAIANNLGAVYDRLGDETLALKYFRLAVSTKKDYARAWCNMGAVFEKTNEAPQAVEAYRKAVEYAPHDIEYALALGRTLGELGRTEEARTMLTLFAADHPDNPQAHLFLGYAAVDGGDLQAALHEIKILEALQPNYAHQLRARMEEARSPGGSREPAVSPEP